MEQRITPEQTAALSANAPSRQVRRALQRRVEKHNRRVGMEEEATLRLYRAKALRELKRNPGAMTALVGGK